MDTLYLLHSLCQSYIYIFTFLFMDYSIYIYSLSQILHIYIYIHLFLMDTLFFLSSFYIYIGEDRFVISHDNRTASVRIIISATNNIHRSKYQNKTCSIKHWITLGNLQIYISSNIYLQKYIYSTTTHCCSAQILHI